MTPSKLSHGRHKLGVFVVAALVLGVAHPASAQRAKKPRPPALRFTGRLQMLTGAAFALPKDFDGNRRFVTYVPVDLELGVRLGGPLGLVMGGVGYAAPFSVSACEPSVKIESRPNALGAFFGMRLDFNNSRDGSWWSPWAALRVGVLGQNGVPDGSPCVERFLLGLYLSPRVGVDLWLGKAAVTFAVGYDHLPFAAALSAQVGLTLRLF